MRIERIKIQDAPIQFEETFIKSDNVICVIDNQEIVRDYYKNGFLTNMLSCFNIKKQDREEDFSVVCDVNILGNDEYTIKTEKCIIKEDFANGKNYRSILERKFFTFDVETHEKNKNLYGAKYDEYLEEGIGINLTKELVVFNEDTYKGLDSYLYEYLINCNCWTKESLKTIIEQFNKLSPITLENGDNLFINISKNIDDEWTSKVIDQQGKEYSFDQIGADISLIEFIIANQITKEVPRCIDGEDFPIFICDVFDKLKPERIKTIMDLIKGTGKQVFIILREHNELVESYCDKTVEYCYVTHERGAEELPF